MKTSKYKNIQMWICTNIHVEKYNFENIKEYVKVNTYIHTYMMF